MEHTLEMGDSNDLLVWASRSIVPRTVGSPALVLMCLFAIFVLVFFFLRCFKLYFTTTSFYLDMLLAWPVGVVDLASPHLVALKHYK